MASTLLNNLLAYWKLDESSGNASDSTGNGKTLTNNNTVGYTTGKINNCADFGASNTNKFFDSSDNLGINGGAISFNFWAKVDTQPTTGQYQHMFVQGNSTNRVYNFIRYFNDGGTLKIAFARGKQNIGDDDVIHTATLTTGVWQMLTLTYNGSTLTAYLNGTSVGSVSASGSGTGTYMHINGIRLARHTLNAGGEYLKGMMDEVAVWNRALTSGEVMELYNSNKGLSYPFTKSNQALLRRRLLV